MAGRISIAVLSAGCNFALNRWHHIALNYSPTSSALYINGGLIGTGGGVTNYPALSDRTNGMVIGNASIQGQPINGQIDELETFNYPLTQAEIQRKFNIVKATDTDLNEVPDILEDIVLANSTPFLGFPIVVTGTIEAEQFDQGGNGIAYSNSGGLITNTGPLTIAGANCANVTVRMLYLPAGTNVMRLVMLTIAPGTSFVGKFNY